MVGQVAIAGWENAAGLGHSLKDDRGRRPAGAGPAAHESAASRRHNRIGTLSRHLSDAEEVAATFAVSRAWVHRLVQRRRETGSIAPRQQTKFRSRVLAGHEARLAALIAARPDATLAELREALPTTAALSTLWLEIDRLGLTVNKTRTRRRTTPTRRRR